MKLKLGLGDSYTIRPGNGVGLFYCSWTHTWRENKHKMRSMCAINFRYGHSGHFCYGERLHFTLYSDIPAILSHCMYIE